MKKFKKLISTVTLVAFCTLSYSPAFASVAAEQPVMDECVPQEITEIIVKDPETKAWLESEESPYSDIPVTLVDEFPADVEAEFDAMLSSTDDVEAAAVPEDGVEPANVIILGPLAQWAPAAFAALLAAGLLEEIGDMIYAKATDLADTIRRNDSPDYYATNFRGFVIYVGDSISLATANTILINSVEAGHDGRGIDSWRQNGNVMCKNETAARGLCSYYQVTTSGTCSVKEPPHREECGYYYHFHVGKSGQDLTLSENHSAHIWFYT